MLLYRCVCALGIKAWVFCFLLYRSSGLIRIIIGGARIFVLVRIVIIKIAGGVNDRRVLVVLIAQSAKGEL